MVSESWKKILKYFFIAAIIIFLLLCGTTFYLFDQSSRQSERHNFHYSIQLSYTRTIENVTILLPVPLLNGTTVLAEPFLNRTVHGIPDDWNLSIERVNGMPMLAIRAVRMVPEYHGFPIAIEPGQSPLPTTLVPGTEYSSDTPILQPISIGTMHSVQRTIDTHNPVGNEPVFVPDGEFILLASTPNAPRLGKEYSHTVPAYLSFTTDGPAEVHIATSIQGTNSIWWGGWVYNRYADTVTWDSDHSTGWTNATASLYTEEGIYY